MFIFCDLNIYPAVNQKFLNKMVMEQKIIRNVYLTLKIHKVTKAQVFIKKLVTKILNTSQTYSLFHGMTFTMIVKKQG